MTEATVGATYSWGVFTETLRRIAGLTQAQVQLPYTCFQVTFAISVLLAGATIQRWNLRASALAGTILFGLGWAAAGFFGARYPALVLAVGLVNGIGAGLAYVVPIEMCVRWFPERRGLATGIAIAGYGGGAALIAQAAGALIGDFSYTPYEVFRLMGAVFLGVGAGCALLLKTPPEREARAEEPRPIRGVLGEERFWLLCAGFLAGLCAGLAVVPNLKQILGRSLPDIERVGTMAVTIFAISNAAGRPAWGFAHDRLGGKRVILANLLIQGAVMVLAPRVVAAPPGLYIFAALVGFNYGGMLAIYPAETAANWGAARLSRIYSIVFSWNLVAAAVPYVCGGTYDALGTFAPAFNAVGALILAAAAAIFLRYPAEGAEGAKRD